MQFMDGIHASFSSIFCFPAASNEHIKDLTVSFPKRKKKDDYKIRKYYHSQNKQLSGWRSSF